jgi:hypothetical protein
MTTYYLSRGENNSLYFPTRTPGLLESYYPGQTVFSDERDYDRSPVDSLLYFLDELPAIPGPAPEELEAQFNAAVGARLEAFAQENGWDSLDRALEQRGVFAADAAVAQKAYDDTWRAAFPLAEKVKAGTMTAEDALAALPALEWPAAPEPEPEAETAPAGENPDAGA